MTPDKDGFMSDEEFYKLAGIELPKKPEYDFPIIPKETMKVAKLLGESPNQATEYAAKYIVDNYNIKTVRNDKNPQMYYYNNGIYVPHGRTLVKEITRRLFFSYFKPTILNTVMDKVETLTYVEEKEFYEEQDNNLIPVNNGIFDMNKDILLPFNPGLRFFSKININYDKSATCPEIIKFFQEVIPEHVDVIQELFGYCLLRDYPIHKFFIFSGEGRNGKTQTLNLLRHFLGQDNTISIGLQTLIENEFRKAELHKKLANISGDMSPKALYNIEVVKELIGGDQISADRKHMNSITFVNYAKLIFALNKIPAIYQDNLGIWSKIILLEFDLTFLSGKDYEMNKHKPGVKKANPGVIKGLTTENEMSGLFNWAVEGYKRLMAFGQFTYDVDSTDTRKTYMMKSNSIKVFIDEACIKDYNSSMLKDDFMQTYMKWCFKNGVKPSNPNQIKTCMEEQGIWETQPTITNDEGEKVRPRHYNGIRINHQVIEAIVEDAQATHGARAFPSLSHISHIGQS